MINIIIPNLDGKHHLEKLLPTIEAQSFKGFDVTVVDNGSTDSSLDFLERRGICAIALGKNIGFAAACNKGAAETQGNAIFFLNNDTMLDRNCMKRLDEALASHPGIEYFAPTMLRQNNRDLLDGAGDVVPRDMRPVKRAAGLSAAIPLDDEVVLPCGGAALWRRDLFEWLGGFDEDFFAYLEDLDIGMRALLGGARGAYIEDAVVYHLGAGTLSCDKYHEAPHDNPATVRWVARNKIWLWAKVMPASLLARFAPWVALGLIKSSAHHTFRSRQPGAFFSGTLEGIAGLPKMLQKRKAIQSGRKITNRELARWIKKASRS